jgi:hypothetical protein
MKQLKPSQSLPEHFKENSRFDLNENRGLGMILNLTGLGLLFGVGGLFVESLNFLRPEYVSAANVLIVTGMREFWRGVLLLVVSFALVVLLREGLHWLVLWIITGDFPKLSFRGLYAYAAVPEWYLPRRSYIWQALVPLFGITVMGVIAVVLVPLNLVPGVMLVVSLNVAMSVNDLATLYWLMGKPKESLFIEDRDCVQVFSAGE